jgi:putative ATP-dependent endonuclease of OLD family
MKFDKLQIKNFKCFNDEGAIIDNLKMINVIIGKNNSGKSSMIELFRFLITNDASIFKQKRNNKIAEIMGEHITTKELLEDSFPLSDRSGSIGNCRDYGLKFGKTIKYSISERNQKQFLTIDKEYDQAAKIYFDSYVSNLKSPLTNKQFSHLSAERDIHPEPISSTELYINTKGGGATDLIQKIINNDKYDSSIIEVSLLNELNKILNPDIEFSRILVQNSDNNVWEIYLENLNDGRIPLSKMGSGIKTVLLLLILLHVKPKLDGLNPSQYVFALEELENNLHPSLQRRLYLYLYEFAKKHKCIFILTTHSNIVIDLYSSLEDTQLFHISKEADKTSIKSILNQKELKTILDDLDVRASDILQCNGIIWVEGPSDRIFLKKWIKMVDDKLIEGNHYSIMFYGGRLLSNLSFDYDTISNELIPLFKLNSNSYVVIDRDGKINNAALNTTKDRITQEIGDDNAWVTKGREIENYLSNNTIKKWLSSQYGIMEDFDNDSNTKIEDNISKIKNAEKIKYNSNKNRYALEIIKYIETEDMNILDLKSNLDNLILTIKKWNKM